MLRTIPGLTPASALLSTEAMIESVNAVTRQELGMPPKKDDVGF